MPPKKKANGYQRPVSVPKGTILADTCKKKWVLGSPVGSGGFGDLYMAAEGESAPKKDSDFTYVVKVEPSENGPLFVERHFYARVGSKDKVSSWISSRKLKTFGMPVLHGAGNQEINGSKVRFIVIDRFSTNIWSLFLLNKRVFPLLTVLQIALQVHDVLEYIHSQEYVHADIKGENLLLGFKKGTENQVYLVDFGLASKFCTGEYKRDPKKAHNGTIEYTSRDAHFGVPTRRGDYEILAYNMIQWLSSKLPWEDLKDPALVEQNKLSEMKNVPGFLKKCFGKQPVPDVLRNFVLLVAKLEPNETPDYAAIRKIFVDGIKSLNGKVGGVLEFSVPEEQENVQASKVPAKSKRVRASPRKGTKPEQNLASEAVSSDALDGSPKIVKRVKRTPAGSQELKKKSKEVKAKPSWRDCPSAQASQVVKAGEYVSLKVKKNTS